MHTVICNNMYVHKQINVLCIPMACGGDFMVDTGVLAHRGECLLSSLVMFSNDQDVLNTSKIIMTI